MNINKLMKVCEVRRGEERRERGRGRGGGGEGEKGREGGREGGRGEGREGRPTSSSAMSPCGYKGFRKNPMSINKLMKVCKVRGEGRGGGERGGGAERGEGRAGRGGELINKQQNNLPVRMWLAGDVHNYRRDSDVPQSSSNPGIKTKRKRETEEKNGRRAKEENRRSRKEEKKKKRED